MNVKVITRIDEHALIEWVDAGQINRSIVPANEVQGNTCEQPERGVPYGEDWAALLSELNVDLLVSELHRRGIWTADDLQANHKAALGAIHTVAGELFNSLLSSAKARKARK